MARRTRISARLLDNAAGDAAEDEADFDARLLHLGEERGRVWAMAAGAVARHLPGRRGIGDDRAVARGLHGCKAARGARGAGDVVGEEVGQGVVAAGVEDDDGDARAPLDILQHIGKAQRAVAHRHLALDLDVDGEDVVLVVDLYAVAGVVEDRGVGPVECLGKLAEGLEQLRLRGVVGGVHLEAEAGQRLCDGARVVDGIGKRCRCGVGRVADDHGDFLFLRGGNEREGKKDGKQQDARRETSHELLQ